MADALLNWEYVDSSNVRRVAYDEDSETLAVEFNNGGLYSYQKVSNDVYQSMIGAPSVGRYFAMVVKHMYAYTKHFSEEELINTIMG